MIKKLCITLFALAAVAPSMAQQQGGNSDASFAPQKGNWQVMAVMGKSTMFNTSIESYLLDDPDSDNIGLGYSSSNESTNPNYYLTVDEITSNSMMNVIGLQGSYFITDRISVTAMFSMNIGITPKKDYVEGDDTVENMTVPGTQYIEGQLKNYWYTTVGSNYYFPTKNERISLYAGAQLGWQMGRIQTQTPYTGVYVDENGYTSSLEDGGVPEEVYYANNNGGQIIGVTGSLAAGIEYVVAEGVVVGFEVLPVSYTFNRLSICPQGSQWFHAINHNLNLFALPNLKVGFRF